MQQLTICLWLDRQAEGAAEFYTALIPNSKIGKIQRYGNDAAMACMLKMQKLDIAELEKAAAEA